MCGWASAVESTEEYCKRTTATHNSGQWAWHDVIVQGLIQEW